MKNYFKIILTSLLIASQAFAGLPPTTAKGQAEDTKPVTFNLQAPNSQLTTTGAGTRLIETGNGNLLLNPSFEHSTYSTSWTLGSGTPSVDTSTFMSGVQSFLMNTSSSSNSNISQSVTPGSSLFGLNLEASCKVKTTITNMQVCALQGGSQIACVAVPSTGVWAYVPVNMPAPASGSIGVQVYSTGTSTGSYNVDDCYVGPARNIAPVAQAILIGSVTVTGCSASWSTTGTSLAAFSTQTSCSYSTTGQAQAPSTNIPAIKFATLPPGDYKLEYEGLLTQTTTNKDAYFQFTDGTNTARELSTLGQNAGSIDVPGISQSISYSVPQSNVTLQVYGKTDSAGTAKINGTTNSPGVIRVWYFPSQSQQAVTAQQADYPETAYTPTFGAGWGTTTNIKFYHWRKGDRIFVKGTFTAASTVASSASISFPNSVTIDSTKISNSSAGSIVGDLYTNQNATLTFGTNVYKLFYDGSTTSALFVASAANGTQFVSLNGNSVTAGGTINVEFNFPVSTWIQTNSAPLLVGGVSSNSTGARRFESISFGGNAAGSTVCGSTPCTVMDSSDGSTVTRSAAGTYSIVPATNWTSVPSCTVNANPAVITAAGECFYERQNSTTSSLRIHCLNSAQSAGTDAAVDVICTGSR